MKIDINIVFGFFASSFFNTLWIFLLVYATSSSDSSDCGQKTVVFVSHDSFLVFCFIFTLFLPQMIVGAFCS